MGSIKMESLGYMKTRIKPEATKIKSIPLAFNPSSQNNPKGKKGKKGKLAADPFNNGILPHNLTRWAT